jgi:hypothetical protein
VDDKAKGESGGHGWRNAIITGVVTLASGLILFAATKPGGFLNPTPPPTPPPPQSPIAMGGSIVSADMTIVKPCCTFTVKVHLTGLQGSQSPMTWVLINADSGAVIGKPEQVPSPFGAEAQDDTASESVRIPVLPVGRWYVQFVLYNHSGVELDRRNTAAFAPR